MATPKENFAIAAAHNLTPRAAATWSALVPRTPRVMVPIHLDALVVRQEGAHYANCIMKTPPAAQGDVAVPRLSLLPDPFSELPQTRRKGVYLHWALPDGLTHATVPSGSTDPNTQAQFPPIPDRWLVIRMFPSPRVAPRRAIRGWVLRTGEAQPVVVDLDSWIEPGTKQDTKALLTAAGHGDPGWAAYYDNVVNRLGFYDDLSDVAAGPIAYLVCGWYSDPKSDPLGTGIRSLSEFDQTMAQLGWELATGELDESHVAAQHIKSASMLNLATMGAFAAPQAQSLGNRPFSREQIAPLVDSAGSSPAALDASGHPQGGTYTTNGAWWPTLTVYHGSVVAIGWPSVGFPGQANGLLSGEIGGPPDPSKIKIVFGNTLAEAMGEIIAQTNKNPAEGRSLEALMIGGLNELEQADGAARIDALLHANSFGSMSGGEVTETITLPDRTPTPPIPANPVKSAPGIFQTPSPGRFGNIIATQPGLLFSEVPRATSSARGAKEAISETTILKGGLTEAVSQLDIGRLALPDKQKPVQVKRSLPRFFYPGDPVFLLQGCDRSFKHGGDGRFSEDGKLVCRLTGFALTELACSSISGGPVGRPSISGDDLLERGAENGSIPPECEDLLREAVLLDPGASVPAAQISTGLSGAKLLAQAQNVAVEQTAWWATRDPRTDAAPLVAKSGYTGMIPSPIAVNPPTIPWSPLHLDWEVQYIPSAHDSNDWNLDETDYHPKAANLPAANDLASGFILTGRVLLTGGAAATIASSVRVVLKQASQAAGSGSLPPSGTIRFHSGLAQSLTQKLASIAIPAPAGGPPVPPPIDRSSLQDIASTLENMDVLVGALDNFRIRLRGKVPDPPGTQPSAGPLPTPFLPMRAGFLRLRRLRLVDCFGQFLDLAGSSNATIADPAQWIKTQPVHVDNREDIAMLPPRFTSPSRLWLRFRDGGAADLDASATVSPVCGYLLPNHLDGALEFFDTPGTNLGIVHPDPAAGIVWEEAPGQPSTVGKSPGRVISNPFLAGIAQGLIDWGVADASPGAPQKEDALSALLRIVDSTLWSVDPYGHIGDEHMALLTGHPIAVLRAKLRVEVSEPVTAGAVNQMRIPVRIGALVHWQDGLFGYFVNDDYRTLYCVDKAVAGFAREVGPGRGFLQPADQVNNFYQTFSNDLGANVAEGTSPVNHPYVNDDGVLFVQPNQEVDLTLLVEPHSVVHGTSGLLPRKEIGMRREWIADALAKLSPTFRFGPVLVDPKRIRMPVSGDIQGKWSWDHRTDLTTWAEDNVVNSTHDAMIPPDPAQGQEGWLRLVPKPQE